MNYRNTPLAAAIVAALYPAVGHSQQRGGDATRLQEVTVTATRRSLDLQDVAQSIAALSTADIEKQKLQNLDDVIGALTSANLIMSQPGRNSLVMRGVSTGSSEYYTDSQVSVYLDDQPMTSISQQVDVRLIDIARIESLPGPQGTLFGSSSQAGTIRYITNQPEPADYSSQIDAEFGTTKGGEESYDVSGHVNVPLADNFAIRAVAFYSVEGGYVDNVLGTTLEGSADNAALVEEDFNDYVTKGGRVAARWLVNTDWEATATLIAQHSDADGAWDSDPEIGDYKIIRFFDEYRDDDWYQASMSLKGDLGFAELSLTASYFDRDIAYEWDNMTYENWRTAYYGPYYALYDTDYGLGTTFNFQVQDRWTYEARLTSKGEGKFQWMAGAFYEDVYDWWHYGAMVPNLTSTDAWEAAQAYAYYAVYEGGYDLQYPLPDTDIYYSNVFEKKVKQKALFGELTYNLTDRWSVTGGLRWFEYDRREFETDQVPLGLPVFDVDGSLGGLDIRSGKDDDVVYKFGTQFKLDDDRMLYFLYSEGFRLGGSNSARAASTGQIPLIYGPDKLENYELGLKSTWLDDRVLLNANLFFMEWSDIQLNQSTNIWWVHGTFNGGKAEQKGIELNGKVNVSPNLSFEGSVFFADPEFTEDTIEPDGDIIEAGTDLPVSPKRKFWISADYKFPGFGANGEFWTRLSYNYQSSTWNNLTAARESDSEQKIPEFSSANFQIGFTHNDGWETALIVRNLFDEKGQTWLGNSDYGALFGDPRFRNTRSLQRPRSIGLTFSKKW